MKQRDAIYIIRKEMNYNSDSGEWSGLSPQALSIILEKLGLIEYEEQPKTATERAVQAINDGIQCRTMYQFRDGKDLLEVLSEAGVRIVDR